MNKGYIKDHFDGIEEGLKEIEKLLKDINKTISHHGLEDYLSMHIPSYFNEYIEDIRCDANCIKKELKIT